MRALLVLLLVARTAAAEPVPEPEPASEGVALGLSLGGTAISWALVIGASHLDTKGSTIGTLATIGLIGTFLAPSAGHWYADDWFPHGMKTRLLGVGSAGLGALIIVGNCIGEDSNCDGSSSGIGGAALILLGMGLYGYGTIHDIATAPRAARAHNLVVAPLIETPGLAVAGQF